MSSATVIPMARPTDDAVWVPTADYVARSRLRRFYEAEGLTSLEALMERAATDPEWFWDAVVRDLDIRFFEPYREVLDRSRGVEWSRWYVGGRLNYVHNAVDRHASGVAADRPAVLWESEDGSSGSLSYRELHEAVSRLAGALGDLGVRRGDRVGIYLPLVPEVAVAALACSKIGAVYVPLFSGFAAPAIAMRLNDAGARVLITADGFHRRGAEIHMKEVADEALERVPSIEHVLVLPRLFREIPWREGRDIDWHEAVERAEPRWTCLSMDSEDPFLIIYTSGTTGRPKGSVHVHGGFPIKGAQDMAHLFDVHAGDRLFWLTDMGWIMGPWEISGALSLGATVFLYDGAVDHPHPGRLWEMVERHRINVFGISPTAIRALMLHGTDWVHRHDRSSLRVLGSTGEPWNPEPWRWFFQEVGEGRCPIINYSGGTEIAGGILGGTTLQPLKPCSFGGPVPGMAADVVDAEGTPLRGTVGELVIRQPWPGMTRGFWGEPERYVETYWSRFPGVWVHGDWALIDQDGFWYIQGRSDDTLNVAGKRIGPAEIESAVVAHHAVRESAAIGVPHELKGESIVVFAVLRADHRPSVDLAAELSEAVVRDLGKPFRPREVHFVDDLPKTRNAKIMRRVIRTAYLGTDPGDLTALENPAAVEGIRESRGRRGR